MRRSRNSRSRRRTFAPGLTQLSVAKNAIPSSHIPRMDRHHLRGECLSIDASLHEAFSQTSEERVKVSLRLAPLDL
jgi:hypothetical protein